MTRGLLNGSKWWNGQVMTYRHVNRVCNGFTDHLQEKHGVYCLVFAESSVPPLALFPSKSQLRTLGTSPLHVMLAHAMQEAVLLARKLQDKAAG